MDDEITYPLVKHYTLGRVIVMRVFMWLFIAAAAACVIVNIYSGGKAWSVVCVFCLWWIWVQFINPDIVNYNRISQFVKGTAHICILLILLNIVLSLDLKHWIGFILPIVSFAALAVLAVLLFSDFRKQKYNIMPLVSFDFYCMIGTIAVWIAYGLSWPVMVLLSLSFCLLIAFAASIRGGVIAEFKKYFSTK
jgi:hypothetical protein